MRQDIASLLRATLVIAAATAEAQGSGYVVAGPAGVSGFFGSSATSMHAAAGGEALMGGSVGVAGEAGLLANSSNVLWVVSANGVGHLARAQVSPFITGGYTRMGSAEGGFNAWNAGAGVDVWAKPRLGFRLDFRDHIRPDERGTVHYWTVRGGVVFR